MGAFLIYIAKSAVCLAMFYLFYRLLLSKETFHRFNRIALLGILALSCAIPFAKVTLADPMGVNRQLVSLEGLLLMAEFNPASAAGTYSVAGASAFPWFKGVLSVYWAGVAFFFFRNAWSFLRMSRLIKRGSVVGQENGMTLVSHQGNIAPFSWMKYVVISEKDLHESGREILIHEYAHLRKHHSIDLLLADICVVLQWFNPAAWLLKQELQAIHEYEADESVIEQGVDARQYQLLLIKKAVGTRLYSMANSFNHSSLKKRITMMLKEKSSPWARLKYLYILPLAAIAVAAFARPEVSKELHEISNVKVSDFSSMAKADEVKSDENQVKKESVRRHAGQMVEEMPEFPGGLAECIKFIKKNIVVPVAVREKKIGGKVIVQFVVGEDGSILSPQVVRSVNADLDNEALRVVALMPKWRPGKLQGVPVKTKFTLPISFVVTEGMADHLKI